MPLLGILDHIYTSLGLWYTVTHDILGFPACASIRSTSSGEYASAGGVPALGRLDNTLHRWEKAFAIPVVEKMKLHVVLGIGDYHSCRSGRVRTLPLRRHDADGLPNACPSKHRGWSTTSTCKVTGSTTPAFVACMYAPRLNRPTQGVLLLHKATSLLFCHNCP